MAAKWPTNIAADADLYVAVNSLQTTLSSSALSGDTTLHLSSTTGFPTAGAITVDNEVIFYTNISGNDLTGCTRGADGTTAAAHSAGVPVGATIVAFHHNGLKDEIKAIETDLNARFGRGASSNAITVPSAVTFALQSASHQAIIAPASIATADRTYTIPDIAGNGTFAFLEGTQTFSGAKTFSSALAVSAASGNTLVVNSTDLIVDSTNHRVGIGATPDREFLVRHDQAAITWLAVDNENSTSTADATLGAIVGSGTSGDPNLKFAIGGGGATWTIGADNSDSDKFKISASSALGTTDIITCDLSYITCFDHVIPHSDNSLQMGASGARWTAVWAANGTIQTSIASTKTNIVPINEDDPRALCKVPQPALFTRPGEASSRQRLGWLADTLPDTAHPFKDDGTRDPESVYTDAILAMHSLALRRDFKRLAGHDAKITALETRVAALESEKAALETRLAGIESRLVALGAK